MTSETSALESLLAGGVRLLIGTIVDNAGVLRVKTIPAARLEDASVKGIGLSPAFAVMCSDDHIAASPGYGGPSGDMRLFPDLDAAVIVDRDKGLAWAPLDQYDQDLATMEICQRQTLKRQQEQAAGAGYDYLVAFELEFTVLDAAGEPAHRGPGYGLTPFLALEDFSLDVVAALEATGVPVEQFHPEYGPGQMEVSLAPASPLAAADRYVLARLLISRVAARHGLQARFAPTTAPDAIGNGCHIHFSASTGGRNVFANGDGIFGMTTVGEHMIAGIVSHLQETAGLFTPGALSYERLQPGHWSGAYACWGLENREAAVRFIRGTSTRRSTSANVEVKAIDSTSNPYLVTAAILALSQLGVAERLPLPAPVAEAPDEIAAPERAERGIHRLPSDLGTALDLFEKSRALRAALGDALVDAAVAVRRHELDAYGSLPLAERIAALSPKY